MKKRNRKWTDPLLELLDKLSHQKVWAYGLFALMLNGFGITIAGVFISIYYESIGEKIVSVFDPREGPFSVLNSFIMAPLVWMFYGWQSRGFKNAINKIVKNELLGKSGRESNKNFQEWANDNFSKLNQPSLFWFSIIVAIIAMTIWITQSLSPSNPYRFGGLWVWWMINPYYLWLIFIPIQSINVYMVTWILARQLIATFLLNDLFRDFSLNLKPFHPDKCNGVSSIGNFSITISYLLIVLGFWIALGISLPLFFGLPLALKGDTISMLIVYLVIVPIALVAPVWSTHTAMLEYKTNTLNHFAEQIQTILNDFDEKRVVSNVEYLKELQNRYHILMKELHTWPFAPLEIQGFAVSAIMPVVTTAISWAIDNFILKKP